MYEYSIAVLYIFLLPFAFYYYPSINALLLIKKISI